MDLKNKIINLINNSDKLISFKSCIIIYGNSGIGKTYTVNKICDELELNKININLSNVSSCIDLEDLLFKSVTAINFLDIINNNIKKKKIIIIDDYDILLSIDRTINNTLFNILNLKKIKNIPIICICNKDLLKKLGSIKKKCQLIEFPKISNNDLSEILLSYNPKINKNILKNIINNSNNSIQQALILLNNNSYDNNYLIDKKIDVNNLYSKNFDREYTYQIILTESWLIPLRFHENLVIELKNRKTSLYNKNEFYKNFLDDFCIFDILMNNNVINSAINIIISNVYFLSLIPKKNNTVSNLDNFTKLLSYLSLQKKNIKKGFNYSNQFYHIGNYHINSININLYS